MVCVLCRTKSPQACPTLCGPMDCSPSRLLSMGPSRRGTGGLRALLQGTLLTKVALGSSVSCIGGLFILAPRVGARLPSWLWLPG